MKTISFLIFRASPIRHFIVSGDSMDPAIKDGEHVLVNRLSYLVNSPQKGDVVAFTDPRDQKVLIKRVSNVEKNNVFVLGDNKDHSTDSRTFGMITKRDIIGKIVFHNNF